VNFGWARLSVAAWSGSAEAEAVCEAWSWGVPALGVVPAEAVDANVSIVAAAATARSLCLPRMFRIFSSFESSDVFDPCDSGSGTDPRRRDAP
jgi:hypothetical protein